MSAMNLPLSQLISALSLTLKLNTDPLIRQIHIDSRKITQGDVFVALAGECVDGHDFVPLAEQQGAVAVIVSRHVSHVNIPQLLVEDVVFALQRLSAFWRNQRALSHCVLVTGSNGKTSVKEMLTACFVAKLGQDQVCATQGNLNNHLGLPLSLLSLRDLHQVGVFEVGANHVGEIAHLSPLAQPTTAMITSIGLAHMGEFGGLSAIKRAKAEIFTALPKQAIAVVPVLSPDDPLDAWEEWQSALAELQPLVFGRLEQVQDCRGWSQWVALVATRIEQQGDRLVQLVSTASSHWGETDLILPLLGQHQAMNLVGVCAVLLSQGFSYEEIQAGIARLSLPKGRLQISYLIKNCLLIDDSYNANPSSMIAAIQVLVDIPADQRLLVLGDMAELGCSAEEGHQLVGLTAKTQGIDQMYCLGQYGEAYQEGFGKKISLFDHQEALVQLLWQDIQSIRAKGKTLAVLVKGSRSSHMETVITQLQAMMTSHAQENQ